MKFDVIIPTCNRRESINSFTEQILKCNPAPENIIVVDSSDTKNQKLLNDENIVYIFSKRKNQPYQRLLGSKYAESEILIYFDDDLNIVDNSIFSTIINTYKLDSNIVGASVGINYKSSIGSNFEDSIVSPNSTIARMLFRLSGVPNVKPGRISRLGMVGGLLNVNGEVDYFNGPCMSFKKDIVHKIIPFDLLSLYERKLGKGEDKAISMSARKFGKLFNNAEIFLEHPENESNYFNSIFSFVRRSTYSRLYLSKIYAEVFNKSLFLEIIAYYWFIFCRILIASFSLVINYSSIRKEKLKGLLAALKLSVLLKQNKKKLTPEINWEIELSS